MRLRHSQKCTTIRHS